MKDLAFDKPFDYELRRMVAPVVSAVEFGQHVPNVIRRFAFSNTECRNLITRFYDDRRLDFPQKFLNSNFVEYTGEFRTRNTSGRGYVSHRQLVAKPQSVGARHSGHLHVLTGACGRHHVKFIQADDTIDRTGASDIRDCTYIFAGQRVVLDSPNVIQSGPHPRLVQQLFSCDEGHVPACILSLVEKLVAFVLACNADDVTLHIKVRNTQLPSGVITGQSLCFE